LVVSAHLYGYVLTRGVPWPDPVTGALPVIRHRCDEPSCQAAGHLATGSPTENTRDYLARRWDPCSPLNDRRRPRGRAGRSGTRTSRRWPRAPARARSRRPSKQYPRRASQTLSRCCSEPEFLPPKTTTERSCQRNRYWPQSRLFTDIAWLPIPASDRGWRRLAAPVVLPESGRAWRGQAGAWGWLGGLRWGRGCVVPSEDVAE